MEWKEITGKTVDEALTNAMLELGTTIEYLEYEVIEKESSGFLGMFGKPARIKARIKITVEYTAKKFLTDVFTTMEINAAIEVSYDQENATVEVNIDGEEMGVLIGKRGQTLDSLQYLVSLVVNKNSENYIKVKLDTENYRARRKETLENLAKNIAFKVKRSRKPVSLEPMNPYERRIIHSALQNDKYVETYSEGEEPYRKVVINVKKTYRDTRPSNRPAGNYNSSNNSSNTSNNTRPTSNSNYRKDDRRGTSGTGGSSSSGGFNKGYNKPYNTSKSGFNKNYSTDYKKDYEKYKESKEKQNQQPEE
jgi:spoIIIJ-associated protein